MLTGRVTKIHPRGYFFISSSDTAEIFFAHLRNLHGGSVVFDALRCGDFVSFDPYGDPHPASHQHRQARNIWHRASAEAESDVALAHGVAS